MSYRLGLTGSIGMGKSTTAQMFADEGIPVWSADAAVHSLYARDGAATPHVLAEFPEARGDDGSVSRPALKKLIAADPTVLDRLQLLLIPHLAESREAFYWKHLGDPIVLLDVPLLIENGLVGECDGIVVVTVPPEIQRQRVNARGTMTESEVDFILSRQMPDSEKQRWATWIIPTISLEAARAAVKDVLADIRRRIDLDA
jgi:dephospho-CoA kinase